METRDLDVVLDMESSSFADPWSKSMFLEEMKNPFSYCFVIQIKEISKPQAVGFLCFRNIEHESELLKICVHPQYRQMGIGKKFMQFYISFCRVKKIRTFYLEVNSVNQAAIHFYHLFSYQSLGKRNKFYQGKFDALIMVKKMDWDVSPKNGPYGECEGYHSN